MQYITEILAFLAGSGGTIAYEFFRERSDVPVKISVVYSKISFSFGSIKLEKFEHPSSISEVDDELKWLDKVDQIKFSESFVEEWNRIEGRLSVLMPLMPRSYSGEELKRSFKSSLLVYGRLGSWSDAAREFSKIYQKSSCETREEILKVHSGTIFSYLEGSGLISHMLTCLSRGDFSVSAVLPCIEGEGGQIAQYFEQDDSYAIVLGNTALQIRKVDLFSTSRQVAVYNFYTAIEVGAFDWLAEFFEAGSQNMWREKNDMGSAIKKFNEQLYLATPEKVTIDVLAFNSGRFSAAISPEILLSTQDPGVPSIKLTHSDTDDHIILIQPRTMKLISAAGRFPDETRDKSFDIYRAGNTTSVIRLSAYTSSGPKVVSEKKIKFSIDG